MVVAGRILIILVNVLSVLGAVYNEHIFFWIGIVLAVAAVAVDIYHKPTRQKVLTYAIGAVLLALLYVALDKEWITPLMFI
ncbi:hypothetical protein D3C76_220730 [compost metagenome]